MMNLMLKKLVKYWWVGILAFVSVLLVTWKLGQIPRGLDGDEVAVGYYGYSLLHFGSDEYGTKWPLYFKSIGDYKYPMYSYLSMAPVALLGLNVLSSKAVAVVSGLLMLAVVGWWLWKHTKSIAIVAVAMVTAWGSVWWLLFSRGAYESTLGMMLVTVAATLAMMRKRWNWKLMLLMAGLIAAAELSYPATRVFLVSFFGWRLLVAQDKKRALILLVMVALITAVLLMNPQGRVRAESLYIGNDETMWKEGKNQIWEVGTAVPGRTGWLLARVWDNKYVILGRAIGEHYLAHFDPNFLFMEGNPAMRKYAVPYAGMMPVASVLLMVAGVGYVVARWRKDEEIRSWVGFLAAAPLSSAMTSETTSQVRSLLMLPALLALAGLGMKQLLDLHQKKRLVAAMVIAVLLVNATYVWKQYFIHREQHQPWMLGQGLPEIVKYAMANSDKYEAIAIGGDPYIYFLFYGVGDDGWKPDKLKFDSRNQWDSVESMNKVHFGMNYNCPKLGRVGVLYLCKGDEVPINGIVKTVAYYNDNVPAYSAVEFIPLSAVKKRPDLPHGFNYMVESDPKVDGLLPDGDNRLW